jgi:nucleoside-diphosphate-sugar epimerase
MNTNKRMLVAGASGVIGRALIPLLVQAGYDVIGTTRDPGKLDLLRALGASPVVLDALDRESVRSTLQTERPSFVIHQLTDLSRRDFEANSRIRIEGTRNLVDAARAICVERMIAQSISFAYAPGPTLAVEEDPLDLEGPLPRRTTALGVQTLEQTVAEMPEGVVLRYGSLYGPGTWYSSSGPEADRVRRGERAATTGVTSFVHVEDAARAALLALDWEPGIVNVVDDEPATATVWLPLYAEAVGASPPKLGGAGDRGERGASNAKARIELGWEPIYSSWRQGFRQALGKREVDRTTPAD